MTSPISEDRCWDAAGDGAVTGDGHGTACARRSAWSRARMACSVLTISRAGTACRQHHSPPCLVARVPCEHCSGRWSAAFSGCSCQPGPFVLYASRRRSCMCAPRVGLACRACMDELNGCLAGSVRIIVVLWHEPRARPVVCDDAVRFGRSGAPWGGSVQRFRKIVTKGST